MVGIDLRFFTPSPKMSNSISFHFISFDSISRMRLYHMTSIQSAISILRDQEMRPGSHGLCGPGIYFGPNPSLLDRKAREKGVTLCAEVDLGRVMLAQKSHVHQGEDWGGIMKVGGFDSVRCTGLASGDEYIVYDAKRVKSIALYTAAPYIYTGKLQVSADGRSGTGRQMTNHPVRIVAINQRPSWPFPIRLGDAWSDQLGWAAAESLRLA
jgi:hypothetical protein